MLVNKEQMLTLPNTTKRFDELFGPLFKTTIGFDDIFSIMDKMLEDTPKMELPSYPPYNYIKLDNNRWQLEFAVAGFKKDDLSVELHKNVLTIIGSRMDKEPESSNKKFVYRGFAKRKFSLAFPVQDDIDVESCELVDGVLTVTLVKPEVNSNIKQIPIK